MDLPPHSKSLILAFCLNSSNTCIINDLFGAKTALGTEFNATRDGIVAVGENYDDILLATIFPDVFPRHKRE